MICLLKMQIVCSLKKNPWFVRVICDDLYGLCEIIVSFFPFCFVFLLRKILSRVAFRDRKCIAVAVVPLSKFFKNVVCIHRVLLQNILAHRDFVPLRSNYPLYYCAITYKRLKFLSNCMKVLRIIPIDIFC